MDTIFALSTAQGRAGVAVVRLSGPRSFEVAQSLVGPLPAARMACVRRLLWQGDIIDEALILCFSEGASFTGEQIVEFHLHGSRAVVSHFLSILDLQPGLRSAEPGEFTRRALVNGRMDLAQVEGLADLIDAETDAQRRQAVRSMSGYVGQRAAVWRATILRAEALIAALIDFSDEDVPPDLMSGVSAIIEELLQDWRAEVAGAAVAERLRDGFEVAIVGSPNVGKSTLLNALAGREAALTSSIAGTTRDVIEVRMDLRGLPVTFLDTAGLREAVDTVEVMGIERAMQRASAADLRVFLLDDTGIPTGLVPENGDIVLRAKADLSENGQRGISGKTGLGIADLLDEIASKTEARVGSIGAMTRLRHRRALEDAIRALVSAQELVKAGSSQTELVGEELRRARHAMEVLVGRIDVEDVLGEVFARFCIGK